MRPKPVMAALALLAASPAWTAAGECEGDFKARAQAEREWFEQCQNDVATTDDKVFEYLGHPKLEYLKKCAALQEPCELRRKGETPFKQEFASSPLFARCMAKCPLVPNDGNRNQQCPAPPPAQQCTPINAGATGGESSQGQQAAGGADATPLSSYPGSGCFAEVTPPLGAGPPPGDETKENSWKTICQCINRAQDVNVGRAKSHVPSYDDIISYAQKLAANDRNHKPPRFPDNPNLRNADHYLFAWVLGQKGSWVQGPGSVVTVCGLTLGYSSLKINPIMACALGILDPTDLSCASSPSMMEVWAGCRGALDGMRNYRPTCR